MQDITLSYASRLSELDRTIVVDALTENALEKRNIGQNNQSFAFCVYTKENEFVGAVEGNCYYGCCDIDLLWIAALERSKGYGSLLLSEVFSLAKEKQCAFITLRTMDFEARPFYEKHGFMLEFSRRGYDNNSIMYHMIKEV